MDANRPQHDAVGRHINGGILKTMRKNAWPAFHLLLRAHDFASDASCDPWDFAVEISYVIRSLDRTDLRWLVTSELFLHARETSSSDDANRVFVKRKSLNFSKQSCFILGDVGVAVARYLAQTNQEEAVSQPKWDGSHRQLWFGDVLVKHFKIPSRNQVMILAAFQEEGWPQKVDDPLPQTTIVPKRRLHDAIKGLNRHQKTPALRFLGDGTGEAVCWKALLGEATKTTIPR